MNHEQYAFTRPPGDGVPMDLRHVNVLHALAMGLPENALIAEIGSYCGSSATAYIEAMIKRPDLRLHLYEIKPHEELYRLLVECPPAVRSRITLYEHPAHGNMTEKAALVLIDGDHRWPALLDLYAVIAVGCDIIAAHDTHIASVKCQGSRAIGHVLRGMLWREWYLDAVLRRRESTHRGLLVSWPEGMNWVCPAIAGALL